MQSLADGIEEALLALSAYPDIYPIDARASQHIGRTIRRINVKKYWLYYLVGTEKQTVEVVSFLHTLQSKIQLIEDYRFDNRL